MITFLAKRWVPQDGDPTSPAVRQAYGTLCGVVGILLNLLLFAGKFLAGTLSGSVAITADAFNNLADSGSSVVTLLGFKLAGRKPDPEHPFGHGRMEYLSGLVVAALILLMGFELGKSSVEKILHPEPVQFSWVTAGILLASVAVKVYMSLYNRSIGKKINSSAMLATAADCLSDSMSTAAVLVATFVGYFFRWQIDGWVGLLVACLILWAGYNAAKDTISPLMGQAPEPELVRQIEETVMSFEPVHGIHDLVVHDYGPGRMMITLHAEVPATGDILEMHDAIDLAEKTLNERFNCQATIHMDPVAVDDAHTQNLRQQVAELVRRISPDFTIHDFRMVEGPSHTNLIFDVVVPHTYDGTLAQVEAQVRALVENMEGTYYAVATAEHSYV